MSSGELLVDSRQHAIPNLDGGNARLYFKFKFGDIQCHNRLLLVSFNPAPRAKTSIFFTHLWGCLFPSTNVQSEPLLLIVLYNLGLLIQIY